MIKIVQGSILDAQEEYVLQQCDCISTQPKDLEYEYKKEYPWADIYGERVPMNGFRNIASKETQAKPGEIKVFSPGNNEEPNIVTMFTQICPGRPFTGVNKNKRFKEDTPENRVAWFSQCLEKITELNPQSVGMPDQLGCYKNGADWQVYSDLIQDFADKNPNCYIYIYKSSA